ncbi:piggyBac transposable element-derived protein 3-like [Phymastichus coffea]|uniref:piggyBac transposable element-derived protein 3-like n=1 Tax=Phymastichus coffea TaxID=108790 RepID=UPI00273CA2F3|nr:piggyBac transposable element-derived protein 3-like [Phymastichus coffea]
MPKRKKSFADQHELYESNDSDDDYAELINLPNPDDSGDSDEESDNEDFHSSNLDGNIEDFLSQYTYRKISKCYRDDQTKLENEHVYQWVDGEKIYNNDIQNELLLSNTEKAKICISSYVELFEMFFTDDMKNYIIEATRENGYDLSKIDLNTFLGVIILSSFNERKSQRDYWSSDPLLSCDIVQQAITRNTFEQIKSHLKCSKPADKNPNDKAWRVRVLMNKFRKNIQRFGYFQTALSIDEMMAKSYARTSLLQFIRGKPIRRGLKFWGCCRSDGFLLDFDLYCGKDSNENLLNKYSLGSRVVMNLLVPFFKKLSLTEISRFHLYFDNFFTNFDLILHLQKQGLRCTGTIRDNRVPKEARNVIDKKALRGTCIAKHDQNSGINYISIKDSKQVSIASSIAGVSPKLPSQRYSAEKKARVDVHFPCAFHTYNKFMGGVDLHDNHCNNVLLCIRSKKWTWVVLIRLIQSPIVNELVLYNTCKSEDKKVGSKDFTMSIVRQYLENGKKHRSKKHEVSYKELKKTIPLQNARSEPQNFATHVLYISVKHALMITMKNKVRIIEFRNYK